MLHLSVTTTQAREMVCLLDCSVFQVMLLQRGNRLAVVWCFVEAQWLYNRLDFSCRVMVGAAVWCCNEAVWVEVPIQPTAVCFCSHSLACHCGCLTLLERFLFSMWLSGRRYVPCSSGLSACSGPPSGNEGSLVLAVGGGTCQVWAGLVTDVSAE